MFKNSTNINKTNNKNPSFQITEHKIEHGMSLEIQILACDRHKSVAVLYSSSYNKSSNHIIAQQLVEMKINNINLNSHL
jgi:hypothetical protein